MRERGAPLLRDPRATTTTTSPRGPGSTPTLIDAMRELGVLYDRDARGEFLHFYTPRSPAGLFFEVVERRGGYDGYGAANAPVRMAAQRHPHALATTSR